MIQSRCVPSARVRTLIAALVCSAVVLLAPSALHHASPRVGAQKLPGLIQVYFGPSEVWNPSREAISALHGCGSVSFTCVQAAMAADGASDDAVAFYRLTGWFLSQIQDSGGPIQLATVFNPWRANENNQPALLGGVPAVVLPEREAAVDNLAGSAQRDPTWASIQQAYPNVMFWQSSPTLEGIQGTDTGGQGFVYDYRLLNGCHACAVVGLARVAFSFDPDGTYEGAHFLGITQPQQA